MAFDSVAALILFLAAMAAWWLSREARAPARFPIRFGAVLFAAYAVSWCLRLLGFPELMPVVAMMALSLGGAALVLGLFAVLARPLPPMTAVLGLMLALGAAVAAPLAGSPLYALGCTLVASLLLIGLSIGKIQAAPRRACLAMAAALSLSIGGFAMLEGAWTATLLLFAAAVMATARASQLGIETGRQGMLAAIHAR
jgi:hypothetical protein